MGGWETAARSSSCSMLQHYCLLERGIPSSEFRGARRHDPIHRHGRWQQLMASHG